MAVSHSLRDGLANYIPLVARLLSFLYSWCVMGNLSVQSQTTMFTSEQAIFYPHSLITDGLNICIAKGTLYAVSFPKRPCLTTAWPRYQSSIR